MENVTYEQPPNDVVMKNKYWQSSLLGIAVFGLTCIGTLVYFLLPPREDKSARLTAHVQDLGQKRAAVASSTVVSVEKNVSGITASGAVTIVKKSASPTFADALVQLSADDAKLIKAMNLKLNGLFEYQSIEELNWKRERGLPTLEQAIAISKKGPPLPFKPVELRQQPIDVQVAQLLQWALQDQTSLGATERNIAEGNHRVAAFYIMEQLDTPIPAYLISATFSPGTAAGRYQLITQAAEAAVLGDSTLAWRLSKQYFGKYPEFGDALSQLAAAESNAARARVGGICGVDRYTGNPETVRQMRVLRELARQKGEC